MKACGVTVDKADLKVFFSKVTGKKVHELVKEGQEKCISMPSVGGGAPAAGGAPVAAEVVKEEKKEEAETVDMGGLFGDEEDDY